MNLDDAIALVDEKMQEPGRPSSVRDAWRIVRGDLRRVRRPSSELPVVAEDPITAKQRFANATEDLVKAKEEIDDRGGRGDGG
jgi:hypothetical protein